MKEFEEKSLDEIIASGSKEDFERYYEYLNSMKTNSFYRDIVESYEGESIADITYKIMEEEQEKAKELKKLIDKEVLEFQVKTGVGDKVFGSVSAKQIKDELGKKDIKIEKNMIKMDNSISSLGFHNVEIELYPKIVATVKVHLIK